MTRVKYLVVAACFIEGSRYKPRADGVPVHVLAAPGLEGPALRRVEASEPVGEPAGDDGAPEPVEIPADWDRQHHRSIIALAQRLMPGEQRDLKLDEAKAFIAAEAARRAATA